MQICAYAALSGRVGDGAANGWSASILVPSLNPESSPRSGGRAFGRSYEGLKRLCRFFRGNQVGATLVGGR